MDIHSDWVTIIPPEGELSTVARTLLSLADPREVLTAGNGTEFLVPPEVADAYHGQSAPAPVTPAAPTTSQPKRRGRAPKLPETEA